MLRKWQFYFGANDYVEMTEGIDSSMLASLGDRRRRRFLTGICLAMVLFVAAVWTASTPRAVQWLARTAPPLARLLDPAMGAPEASGIRLEIVDAAREGDSLRVHLTLEDLEGDRLSSRFSPQWVTYQQDDSTPALWTREYDAETGLLHLYMTCKPAENMADFDWSRWTTVTVYDLATHTTRTPVQIPITPDPGDAYAHVIWEGLTVTRMTVEDDEFRIFVSGSGPQYWMILTGPLGEQLLQNPCRVHTNGIWWSFDLRGRDIRDCTLTAWVDAQESILGTWTVQVAPVPEE